MQKAILAHYPWQVEEISRIQKGVYKIQAQEGCFVLKKIAKPLTKMEFVWGVMEYLPRQGFVNLPQLITTNGANIPLVFQGDIYFAYQWLSGKKADFMNLADLTAAFSCLADFHNAASGLELKGARKNYFIGIDNCQNMVCDLLCWGERAEKENSEFSKLYLEVLPYYLKRAKGALNLIESANYVTQAEKAAANKSFIHGDVAARNFIIDKDIAYLIDFDYSRYDLPVVDVVRLCQRSLGFWDYGPTVFNEVLAAYNKKHILIEDELLLIIALLSFPQRFWRLGKRYFEDNIQDKSVARLKTLVHKLPDENRLLTYLQENYIKGVDHGK